MTCHHQDTVAHGGGREQDEAGYEEHAWCDGAVDRQTGTSRVTVTVPDMSDRHDLRRVAAHLHDVAGVVAVEIDPLTHAVRVHGMDDLQVVVDAIARAGFRVGLPPPR